MKHPFKSGTYTSEYKHILRNQKSDCYRNDGSGHLYERSYCNLHLHNYRIIVIDDDYIALEGYVHNRFRVSEILIPNWRKVWEGTSEMFSTPEPLSIPSDLGSIEFLRSHPTILKKLIERSSSKSLKPFIIDRHSSKGSGGFTWSSSPEGGMFWSEILENKRPEKFYEKYPKEVTSVSEPTIKFSKGDKVKIISKTTGVPLSHSSVQEGMKRSPYGVISSYTGSGVYEVYTDGINKSKAANFTVSDLVPYVEETSASLCPFKLGDIVKFKKGKDSPGSSWFKTYSGLKVVELEGGLGGSIRIQEPGRSGYWVDSHHLEFDTLKSEDKTSALIEEAKKRFPKGTIFSNKNLSIPTSGEKVTVISTSPEFYFEYEGKLSIKNGHTDSDSNWTIYYDGKWAEIITEEKVPEKWKLKITPDSLPYVNAFRNSLGKSSLSLEEYYWICSFGSGFRSPPNWNEKEISLEFFLKHIWTGPKLDTSASIQSKPKLLGRDGKVLEVATEVVITPGSRYYNNSRISGLSSNPCLIKGIITSIYDSGHYEPTIYVTWSNGTTNTYEAKDLVSYSSYNPSHNPCAEIPIPESPSLIWEDSRQELETYEVAHYPWEDTPSKRKPVEVPLIEVKKRKTI